MPIANVFDPYTGAANGGVVPSPGGGASLYDVAYSPIYEDLTDGSWTLVDPDNLVDSIVRDGNGYHTITWNALAVGSSNYRWDSGTEHRSPRWYKNAVIDGNQLVSEDLTNYTYYAQTDNTARGDFDSAFVYGLSCDPTSTVPNTIVGGGLFSSVTSVGTNTFFGVWAVNSQASTSVGSSDRAVIQYEYGGGHAGCGTFVIVDSLGQRIQNGSRNAAVTLPATTDLKLMVGVGTRSNTTTISAGNTSQKFRLTKVAMKPNLGAVLI
jgi:hypothetical protein